jgi:hypothetical protein
VTFQQRRLGRAPASGTTGATGPLQIAQSHTLLQTRCCAHAHSECSSLCTIEWRKRLLHRCHAAVRVMALCMSPRCACCGAAGRQSLYTSLVAMHVPYCTKSAILPYTCHGGGAGGELVHANKRMRADKGTEMP